MINNVQDKVVFLILKMFNSKNVSIVSEVKNTQVTYAEKPCK